MTEEAPVVQETLAEKLGTQPPAAQAPPPTGLHGGPSPAAPVPPPPKQPSLVLQFVVFPLAIVIIAVAITGFFQWVAQDNRTYDDYLSEIATGWQQKRPEAAYQLQFRLADKSDPLIKTANVPKTIAVFEGAKKDRAQDPSVRRYLAIVLGQLADAEVERNDVCTQIVPTLLDAVSGDEPDQETRLNATWALGRCKDRTAVPALVALLEDPFEGQRKTAAFAIGDVGEKENVAARDALARHLNDPVVDVQWNCATALSRLEDRRAVPTLLAMIDRRYLSSIQEPRDDNHPALTPGEREKQHENVMINALRGLYLLKAREHLDKINAIADNDPSLAVREFAMRVRAELK